MSDETLNDAAAAAGDTAGRSVDVLKLLSERFPVFREFRPLAIGIHRKIAVLIPELDAARLRTAMRRHTGSTRYLKAVATGSERYDLDGQIDGTITDEQKQQAAEALRERFKKGAERRREEIKSKQEQERAAAREREHMEKLQALASKFNKR